MRRRASGERPPGAAEPAPANVTPANVTPANAGPANAGPTAVTPADAGQTSAAPPAARPDRRGEGTGGGGAAPPRSLRRACVDVPAFPLQLLLRREPSWAGQPVAVVAEDRPQGRVLWVSEEARRLRVLPGQRYAASLALAPELRAGVVADDAIRCGVDATAQSLRRFSPAVEPSRDEPGVFWLDAGGLDRIHPDLRVWATDIQRSLGAVGLRSCVTVGFTRFGVYAISRALASRILHAPATAAADGPPRGAPPTIAILPSEAAEADTLRRVPLDRLGIDPDVRDLLAKLGVRTVDRFLDLPPRGLRERFGDSVHRLHRVASGDTRDPLAPEAAPEHLRASVVLEHAESDGTRLLFLVKRLFDPLLLRAAELRESIAGLELRLHFERGDDRVDVLRPAAPTLDGAQLIDLVRLRFEATRLPCGATDVTLTAHTVPATQEQLALFSERPKRDLAAADRAIARLRAEFGEASVVRARLREAHLPEAAFDWVPIEHARMPQPRPAPRRSWSPPPTAAPLDATIRAAGAAPVHARSISPSISASVSTPAPTTAPASTPTIAPTIAPTPAPSIPPPGVRTHLVRRIFAKPLPLPPRPRHGAGHELGGWMLRGLEQGNVVRIEGPYVVAGGWWAGDEVRREYHFAETARGRLFWVFYDVRRRRWFLQGDVS